MRRVPPRFEAGVNPCPKCGEVSRIFTFKVRWKGRCCRCWRCGHRGPMTQRLWSGSPENGFAWIQLWNEQNPIHEETSP